MRKLVCPTCKTRFTVGDGPAEAPYRPFCSKRCQLIDLGHWFNESYRVSRPVTQLDGEALQLEDDTTQEARDPQDL